MAAAKPENRPAGTKTAIADGDKLVGAKKRAGIVLALYIAIYNMYIFVRIEMKTIVVFVHPVINSYSIKVNAFAIQNATAMIGAGC